MNSKKVQERITNLGKQLEQTESLAKQFSDQCSLLRGRLEEATHLHTEIVREEKAAEEAIAKEKAAKKKVREKKVKSKKVVSKKSSSESTTDSDVGSGSVDVSDSQDKAA